MSRAVIHATIEDAEHFTAEERKKIIASYPPHEREARTKGLPSMGSGRVFPITQEEIECEPFRIPDHWPQINGLDFGWDHPTAATNCAWDRDSDTFYVCKEYRKREATPVVHSAAIKPWGSWVPVSWPHDGLQHDKGSGEPLAEQYRQQELAMLPEKATFEDGSNGVEAGIMEMYDRMQTGRWKVFSTCKLWFQEFLIYHRVDGLINAIKDDLICSSRYAMMMRRYAKTKPRSSRLEIPDYGAA